MNWERARRDDLVRTRGAEPGSTNIELPAPPFGSEVNAYTEHQRLKQETRLFLQDARRRFGEASEEEFKKLRRQLERLAGRLASDQWMRQESMRLEVNLLAEDVSEYLRWRNKRPERKDLLKLYADAVAYIEGAGLDFPRVKTCAGAIENLAYLHRWKHAFPSIPFTQEQMKTAYGYLEAYHSVRPLHVRHI